MSARPSPSTRVYGADLSPVIGEAMWVLAASPRYAAMPIAALRETVFEAIVARQCFVYRKSGAPMAAAFWALQQEGWAPPLGGLAGMRRADWNGGGSPVVVDIIAPFGDEVEFSAALRASLHEEIAKRTEDAAATLRYAETFDMEG